MIKSLVRKLYMHYFHDELYEVAKYCRRSAANMAPVEGIKRTSEIFGALTTLETLDLLDK